MNQEESTEEPKQHTTLERFGFYKGTPTYKVTTVPPKTRQAELEDETVQPKQGKMYEASTKKESATNQSCNEKTTTKKVYEQIDLDESDSDMDISEDQDVEEELLLKETLM